MSFRCSTKGHRLVGGGGGVDGENICPTMYALSAVTRVLAVHGAEFPYSTWPIGVPGLNLTLDAVGRNTFQGNYIVLMPFIGGTGTDVMCGRQVLQN